MSDEHRESKGPAPQAQRPPEPATPAPGTGPGEGAPSAERPKPEEVAPADTDAPAVAGGEVAAAVDDLRDERGGAHARRPSAATAMIAVLLLLLGFALVVQLKGRSSDAELASARPEDLVRILSDLDAQQDRLRREIAELEETQRQLASGAQGRDAALAEARRRADELGILAGTLPAEGSGLEIVFTPGAERIRAETILDAVEELRGAGAEAMQIAGQAGAPVRIVASTYFVEERDRLVVAGVTLTAPYTISVIGGPDTMRTALNIPGGVVDSVRQRGGTVSVRETDPVRVTALHTAGGLKHAKPVS